MPPMCAVLLPGLTIQPVRVVIKAMLVEMPRRHAVCTDSNPPADVQGHASMRVEGVRTPGRLRGSTWLPLLRSQVGFEV